MRFALIAGAVLMTSCNHQDSTICEKAPAADAKGSSACVHRTAYQYASAPGSNSELAKAVAARCDERLADEMINGRLKDVVPLEKLDATYTMMRERLEQEALDRIVQARAGKCDKPL